MSVVGTNVDRVDGPAKVSGSIEYTADLELPGMLHTGALRSSHPHARLVRVDAHKAERLPGVTVLTRDDLRGMDPYYGPVIKDQSIVAMDRVRYVGDVIAAVAAEDRDLAQEALELIEVEYESLPAVLDPVEAMLASAPLLHARTAEEVAQSVARSTLPGLQNVRMDAASNVCSTYHLEHGDVEAAFAQADEVFEDTYRLPTIQHGHLEPHATLVQTDASGKLLVYSSTQDPWVVRNELADIFKLPRNQVRVIVPHLGAGYGAKLYLKLEPVVAALARKARRPVRWALTRAEVFLTVVRHAAVIRLKTAVKRDGTLLGRQVEMIYDAGAYAEISPRVAGQAGLVAAGPYRLQDVRVDCHCVYTNKPPSGAFRGFGVSQVCWAYESQMDEIAQRLGLDPLELRLKNLLREGDQYFTGEKLVSIGISDCARQAAEAIGWQTRASQAPEPAAAHGTKPRGKGLACLIKGSMTPSNSAAIVRLNADGSADVLQSGVEVGQGPTTALAQIVAESLGLPVERVTVSLPDTLSTPFDHGTKSSRTTFTVGHAAQQAALQVREQLLDIAAQTLETASRDLEIGDGVVRVKGAPERCLSFSQVFQARFGLPVGSLFGSFDFQTTGGLDPETGKGKASAFWILGAAAAEVEVDTETGKVTVLRAASAADAGKAINPRQCHLQIEGAMLMGLGSALLEELVFEDGQPINASFLNYTLPSVKDFPASLQSLLVEHPHPDGPFGAKGMGEAALAPMAPAIGNAVANALGVRIRELPLRPDRILAALQAAREGQG